MKGAMKSICFDSSYCLFSVCGAPFSDQYRSAFHFISVYVDMGLSSNNPITLTVVTSGSSFSRSFSIKVTQIDCYSLNKGTTKALIAMRICI